MSIQYHRWLFNPVTSLPPEQAEIWWQKCFVPLPAMQVGQGDAPAMAAVGEVGSGKSTAVAWMRRTISPEAFIVSYQNEHWGRLTELGITKGGDTLLEHLFSLISMELIRYLDAQPDKAIALQQNPFAAEFLTWLLGKHLERRTFLRFRHRLSHGLGIRNLLPEMVDLDLTYDGATLSELLETIEILGFNQLVIFIDLDECWAESNLDDLVLLFQVIPILEQQGLLLRAALPEAVFQKGGIAVRATGRLQLARLYFDQAICDQIVQRYLCVATDDRFSSLTELVETAVLARIEKEIEKLYGTQTLAGWLNWTETLLAIYDGKPIHNADEAVYQYYARHVPLRLAIMRQGVWRGPQFIEVGDRLFDLLSALFELKGHSSPEKLIHIANDSSEYLNTLANRLCKIIEPIPKRRVYIQNSRASGYWLENFLL